jgi:adenine-specific DNA-methyltransferase
MLTKEKRKAGHQASVVGNKTRYAQYFTPRGVANFMVGMFARTQSAQASVLDPGAGEGILGLSLMEDLQGNGIQVSATMVEIDEHIFQVLKRGIGQGTDNTVINLVNGDFTKEAFGLFCEGKRFSHVIMNPPYFKLQREGEASDYLLSRGVSVTNIYAAFMWLGLMLLEDGGQLVAIVPRSFCNGPYFLKFREFVAQNVSIEATHTFSSRDKVFSKDSVLQENVIVHFAKKQQSDTVKVTYSSDQGFCDVRQATFGFDTIMDKGDANLTIGIPPYRTVARLNDYACHSLKDTGLWVSTGPVVDFRSKESISGENIEGSVPLLYPAHMKDGEIDWPIDKLSKRGQYYSPQPGLLDGAGPLYCGDKNVSPSAGFYVVVRRFSSKEEKRRIYAAVVDSSQYAGGLAFENHLNYFHVKKHGFDKDLAYGLSAYLNSSVLDEHFRTFSGHTQVNATDLRNIPYPSESQLRQIGRLALSKPVPIEMVVTPEVLRECA